MTHHFDKKKLLREYFFNTYKGVIEKNKIDDVMSYQLDKNRSYEYLDMIESNIDKKSKILDFGSGFGEFIILLNKMNFKAFGVENCKKSFDISLLSWREQFKRKPRFFFCNSSLPFKDDSFDIITLWNVVEHIENLDFYLKEIERVLKKGGKIFILAPNYFSFRKEAHYHVPWIPYLSKKLSLKYLCLIGKNPRFFDKNIFPITKIGLIKKINELGLSIEIPFLSKLDNPSKIRRYWLQQIIKICKKLQLYNLLIYLVKFRFYWPFSKNIFIIVRK